MKLGIILETKELEKAWNAFRFAITAMKRDHPVKVFLMGEAVECEEIGNEEFDVSNKLEKFVDEGGELLACGTCLKSRKMDEDTACPISTMVDCVETVEWADKVVTIG